jgi:hypothetical protein
MCVDIGNYAKIISRLVNRKLSFRNSIEEYYDWLLMPIFILKRSLFSLALKQIKLNEEMRFNN